MAVLVLADHTNSALGSATAKAVTAAKQLGGDVHVLVAGSGASAAAAEAAKLDGVAKVLLADAHIWRTALPKRCPLSWCR